MLYKKTSDMKKVYPNANYSQYNENSFKNKNSPLLERGKIN